MLGLLLRLSWHTRFAALSNLSKASRRKVDMCDDAVKCSQEAASRGRENGASRDGIPCRDTPKRKATSGYRI